MARFVIPLSLIVVLVAAVFVPTVHGGSVSAGGSAIVGTFDGSNGCYDWDGEVYPYDATEFTVQVSGEYTFTAGGTAAFLNLLEGTQAAFNPNSNIVLNPNYVGHSLNGVMTVTLQAGHAYLLVVDNDDYYEGDITNCLYRDGTDPAGPYTVTVSPALVPPSAPSAPAEAPAQVVPGCDVQLALPADAAVGTLVSDAAVYWKPGNLASPSITLTAGKSFWVLGLDSTQQYYQIYVQCWKVWIPAGTIGPNYDHVWNGHPLPTTLINVPDTSR